MPGTIKGAKRMRAYESYKEKKYKNWWLLIAIYGVLLEIAFLLVMADEGVFEGSGALNLWAFLGIEALFVLWIIMHYQTISKSEVIVGETDIAKSTPWMTTRIQYADVAEAVANKKVELHLNKICIKVKGHKLNYFFDIGGAAEDREAYKRCLKATAERAGVDIPVMEAADIKTLDEKFFYVRKMRNNRIFLFCTQLIAMLLLQEEEPWAFFFAMFAWLISMLVVKSYMRNFTEARRSDDKIDEIVARCPYFTRRIRKTSWIDLVWALVMIIIINLPLYVSW